MLFQPWAQDVVARAELQGEHVLDLACGTGIVARTAATAATLDAITGVDVNADMLAVARQASPSTRPAITWKQADAASTGLPDGAFDGTFCQQGLQFFADRRASLTELHRVLAPGGRIAVSVWADVP